MKRIIVALLSVMALATAVASPAMATTFGAATEGPKTEAFVSSEAKRANQVLSTQFGNVSKLYVYAVRGNAWATGKKEKLKAVIYDQEGGGCNPTCGFPTKLDAVGKEVVYEGQTGWFELPLTAPLKMLPTYYFIGFISGANDNVMGYKYFNSETEFSSIMAYNEQSFASGPSDPFGSYSTRNKMMSIYGVYE